MTRREFISLVEDMPVIAAVKNDGELSRAVESSCHVVFLLYGDVCTIGGLTQYVKEHNKAAIVHVDLVDGLESKGIAVEFIARSTQADGIISTKPSLIKAAKEQGMLAIQRFFMIDSIAFENMKKHLEQGGADLIEVLPGVMPKIIRRTVKEVSVPVIAGGLISDKEDVIAALGAGASAVSTTLARIWEI